MDTQPFVPFASYTQKTPLERAVDRSYSSIVNYFVKECNQDVSTFDQGYQRKIHTMLQEYEKEHPEIARQDPPSLRIKKDITNSKTLPTSEKVSKALFTSAIPNHLECEICLDVLIDPMQTSCCGQSYCKNCIGNVKNKVCPHCRASLEVFPDKKSVRFINELEIKCPYHIEDKCQWKGSPSQLENHLKNCDIKPTACPLGCGKQFEKKNMTSHTLFFCILRKISCQYCQKQVIDKDTAEHHAVCPKMPLSCPNKCSSKEEITREKMREHIDLVCPDQKLSCKYSDFGCVEKVKRKEYEQHLSSTMERHLSLVAENAKIVAENAKMVAENAKMVAENAQKERKIFEDKIAALEKRVKIIERKM